MGTSVFEFYWEEDSTYHAEGETHPAGEGGERLKWWWGHILNLEVRYITDPLNKKELVLTLVLRYDII